MAIRESYENGFQDAMEKVAQGFWNKLLGGNPMRQRVAAGSGGKATGDMRSNVGRLMGAGGSRPGATSTSTTRTSGSPSLTGQPPSSATAASAAAGGSVGG